MSPACFLVPVNGGDAWCMVMERGVLRCAYGSRLRFQRCARLFAKHHSEFVHEWVRGERLLRHFTVPSERPHGALFASEASELEMSAIWKFC